MFLLAAVVGLGLLVTIVVGEDPDRTTTGVVSESRPHRVCLARETGSAMCVRVNSPQRLDDTAVGDCVRIRFSAENVLADLDEATGDCD